LTREKDTDIIFSPGALKTMVHVCRVATILSIVAVCIVVRVSLAQRIFLFRDLKAGFGQPSLPCIRSRAFDTCRERVDVEYDLEFESVLRDIFEKLPNSGAFNIAAAFSTA
jgi:hypothetical protein